MKNFVGHMRFYKHFVKDFSKVTKPLWEKGMLFKYNFNYLDAFKKLKAYFVIMHIIISLQCFTNFELMFDACDYATGVVFGQILVKHFRLFIRFVEN